MAIIRSNRWQPFFPLPLLGVLFYTTLLLCLDVQVSFAQTQEEAIRRIHAGLYTPMPTPVSAPATGPTGKGMTIENGTLHILHVYFSGPMSRTLVIPGGTSVDVELAVGDYEVAAEVLDSEIIPFYGRHSYQPLTHYWLKFHTQGADPPITQGVDPLIQPPRFVLPEKGVFRIVRENPIELEKTDLYFSFSVTIPPGEVPEEEVIIDSLTIGAIKLTLAPGVQRVKSLQTEELGRVRIRTYGQIWLTDEQLDKLRRLEQEQNQRFRR